MLKWPFLLAFWLNTFWVIGQNTVGLPLIKNYGKTEFKGGSQTWAIDQDAHGRMYFANNEGLITYDGTYWNIFPLPNRTITRSVKVAPDGKIYVGGQGEAGYFLPNEVGGLTFHSILNLIPKENRDFADVWNIEIVEDAVFFRASDQILQLSNKSVAVFTPPGEWVYLGKAGNRLIAQDKLNGVFEWTNRMWKPVNQGGLPGSDIIHGSLVFSADRMILVTHRNKNFLLSASGLEVCQPITPPIKSEVAAIYPVNANEFVMGTNGEGCLVVNNQGSIVQQITSTEGLQDNDILSTFIDNRGNLWAGTNSGITMVAYNAPLKFIKPNKVNDLSGYASKVFDGNLYIATNDGAYMVSLANAPRDLSFTKGLFTKVPNTSGLTYRFDEVNQTLMMAHNEGTFYIKGGNAYKLSDEPSWTFIPTGGVVPASRVLVGNYTGLKWLRYQNNQFIANPNLKGLRESFRFLALDNDKKVWASHPYRGIYQLSFSDDSTSFSARLFTQNEGLPSNINNHVFTIKNAIVFATEQGPYEFDKSKNTFIRSPLLFPVLGTTPIRYLKEDDEGNIWFVSEKKLGLIKFYPQQTPAFTITYFPEVAGQLLSGFESIYPYNRENVFVASEKGIIFINLDKYLQKKDRPKVLLSAVHAFGETDSMIHAGFGLGKMGADSLLVNAGKISLPYKLNSLHFEYSSPAFGFQENIEYSYLLEGFDNEWSKWNSKPEKDFTNLPNGSYIFKIKGRSNLGIETEYAAFAFTIEPPWYKSPLAFIVYLLLLGYGIFLLGYYHRKKLERQQTVYEEKQEQLRVVHQLEIEQNEKEIIRLQNEKLANEVSFKNRELADTTMHLVERSDALERVKETLQKLYKTESSNSDIKRAIHLLNDIERNNTDWDKFSASFDEINNDFLKKLKAKYPGLTNNDLKLCAYLQLNLSSKEIAQLLNISLRGVEISRYRLRKKLGVSTDVSISDFLNEIVS
jgi:ligand-binding sensor domain-containing protein/DNA-binding CsgD family transcriptional regulator